MKYEVVATTRFKKEYRAMLKRGRKAEKMRAVITMLANGEPLPAKYEDHKLRGNWAGHRECHIEPDWLLIYYYTENNVLALTLTRTGTHSDLLL